MNNQWFLFFLGTPRRFLATLAGCGFLFGLVFPEILGNALHALLENVLRAVGPFVEPIMVLCIMAIGFGIMLRAVFPRRGGRRGSQRN